MVFVLGIRVEGTVSSETGAWDASERSEARVYDGRGGGKERR